MAARSLIGTRIDRYEVLAQLGQGGFGVVYRARHTVLGIEVALKVLWPDHAGNPRNVERFLREARTAASVGSPHIVRVLDAGATDDGTVFLAMELLDGRDLSRELVARGGKLGVDEAAAIGRQVLKGLAAAHRVGIVHRDLKPANIYLIAKPGEPGPFAKVLDFGISKVRGERSLTSTGLILGTPQYMAPEQIEETKAIDGRADLYAMGAILYEAWTGRVPYDGTGFAVLVRRVQGELPPPIRALAPHVPDALALVVERALAADRDARWPTAEAMVEALERAQSGERVGDAEPTVPPFARPNALLGAGYDTVPDEEPFESAVHARRAVSHATPIVQVRPPPSWTSGEPRHAAAPSDGATEVTPSAHVRPPASGVSDAPRQTTEPGGQEVVPVIPFAAGPPSSRPAAGWNSAPSSHDVAAPAPATSSHRSHPGIPSAVAGPNTAAHPVAFAALGALALLFAITAGALGVALYHRVGESSAADPRPVQAPRDGPAVPPPIGRTISEDARGIAPNGVEFANVVIQGRTPRPAVLAYLEEARDDVAACGIPGRTVRVSMFFPVTLGGVVPRADPSPDRPSNDPGVAGCVGRALTLPVAVDSDVFETGQVTVDIVLTGS